MKDTADALAASALVLAVLTALFALWTPEIAATIDATISDDPANNEGIRDRVRSNLRTRCWPLFAATGMTAIILFWRCWTIARTSIGCSPWRNCHYDDVQAIVMLTETLLALLCGAIVRQISALKEKLGRL